MKRTLVPLESVVLVLGLGAFITAIVLHADIISLLLSIAVIGCASIQILRDSKRNNHINSKKGRRSNAD